MIIPVGKHTHFLIETKEVGEPLGKWEMFRRFFKDHPNAIVCDGKSTWKRHYIRGVLRINRIY